MEDSDFLASIAFLFYHVEGTKRMMLFAETCGFVVCAQMNM